MAEIFTQFTLTEIAISGFILLGLFLASTTLYRSLRNRRDKKRHRLKGD
jgi:hypothetical protein